MTISHFNFPTRISYGPGALALLPDVLKQAGCQRPLVVTDRGLASLPPIAATSDALKKAGLATSVFAGVWGNPIKSQVTAGTEAFAAHHADAIVAVGGGAAIDVAKAVALMAHHPGDLFDYEDEKPGGRPIDQPLPFFVTVPTTAGTGSEVGRSTVISDDETHVKKIIFSPRLLAARVLVDPELTLDLPAGPTAATGMDALTHLVEAYLAKGFHPMADGIALEGLRLVARNLPRAVTFARHVEAKDAAARGSAEHLEARGMMLNAALMGGVAFQKGLGVTHSLAHALSTVCDLHHGLANGIVIPVAMAFNETVARDRLAVCAATVGASQPTAAGFIDWLIELKTELGIPQSLAQAGVKRAHLDRLVRIAVADGCHSNNPRPVTESDFRTMFEEAGLG